MQSKVSSKPSIHPVLCISANFPKNGEVETYIDDAIAARHKGRSVGGKVDGKVVELVDVAETILRRHACPDLLLRVKRWHPIQRRVHVARRNAIDPHVVLSPLGGEGFSQLDDGGFGGVVTALFLRVVDDRAGHGRDEDDGAAFAGCDHSAAARLSDEKGAGHVDVDEPAELLRVVIFGFDVGAEQIC